MGLVTKDVQTGVSEFIGDGWRLVHDGQRADAPFLSRGRTATRRTLFVGATEAECEAEIARLGLTVAGRDDADAETRLLEEIANG